MLITIKTSERAEEEMEDLMSSSEDLFRKKSSRTSKDLPFSNLPQKKKEDIQMRQANPKSVNRSFQNFSKKIVPKPEHVSSGEKPTERDNEKDPPLLKRE